MINTSYTIYIFLGILIVFLWIIVGKMDRIIRLINYNYSRLSEVYYTLDEIYKIQYKKNNERDN